MRIFLVLFCLMFASSVAKADKFYCVLFAPDALNPKYCHVWGTFVQMKDDKLVKEVTISWAPRGGWSLLDRKREGYNMSLHASMRLAENKRICHWGPYEIEKDFFDKAEKSYNSYGNYKMLDALSRGSAVNCIHRLSELTGTRLVTHVRYGRWAAVSVYRHYSKAGVLSWTAHGDKVLKAIEVDGYKLRKMD